MALFTRTGLEQETGILKEQWAQEGSTPVSAVGGVYNTGGWQWDTMYTVTAGKKFYLKQFIIKGGGGIQIALADGNTTALIYWLRDIDQNTNASSVILEVPILFETSVELGENNSDITITLIGWEE